MDFEGIDLPQLARALASRSPPGSSEGKPNMAMLHLGPQPSDIPLVGTFHQPRSPLDSALSALTSAPVVTAR
jgi:hypothetical protein